MKNPHFQHINTWALDMDGTVYDSKPYVVPMFWKTFSAYIDAYVPELKNEDHGQIYRGYIRQHGTIHHGMAKNHGVDILHFLDRVHDFDVTLVPRDQRVIDGFARLPGDKVIFTNAPRDFALRMTAHLGLTQHLKGIFALEDMGYDAKPAPHVYDLFLKKHGLDPLTTAMVEDTLVNLGPAQARGMTTVFLHGGKTDPHPHYVHHAADTIVPWLETLVGPLPNAQQQAARIVTPKGFSPK